MDTSWGVAYALDPGPSPRPQPRKEDIVEEQRNLENWLKGQGHLSPTAHLNVTDPTVADSATLLQLVRYLASQQQHDTRAREQLRDQADKDRVQLSMEQKKNAQLEERLRGLSNQLRTVEGQLRAEKDRAAEAERDLKQKLQSTTARLNGCLNGKQDAWGANKRNGVGGAGGAAGVGGASGAQRRPVPAFDRFRDDPAEAGAAMQKLERELAQLKKQNAELQKRLAESAVVSPRGVQQQLANGGRRDQADRVAGSPSSSATDGNIDMQDVQRALAAASQWDASNVREEDLFMLRRTCRDLSLNVKALQRQRQELQRQLDKAASDKSELHKSLQQQRQRCAALEVERRNADDRLQRAQAALSQPAASEEQLVQLREQLAEREREARAARVRCSDLEHRLEASTSECQRAQRYTEVLKRGLAGAAGALAAGESLEDLLRRVALDVMEPAHQELHAAKMEVLQLKQELDTARDQLAAGSEVAPSPSGRLPLTPAGRFDGFQPGPVPFSNSPPMLQPPAASAFYSRRMAATMPSPHSERHVQPLQPTASAPHDPYIDPDNSMGGFHHQTTYPPAFGSKGDHPHPAPASGPSSGTASPLPDDGTDVGLGPGPMLGRSESVMVTGTPGGPSWRRSLSAGVQHRPGGVSVERRKWQVPDERERRRHPSPIMIMMEGAQAPVQGQSARKRRTESEVGTSASVSLGGGLWNTSTGGGGVGGGGSVASSVHNTPSTHVVVPPWAVDSAVSVSGGGARPAWAGEQQAMETPSSDAIGAGPAEYGV